ncbi:hypothetical protein Cch01nite_13900 [Cellulomonas chitinilytica]|uniref:Uncharacterized protein n=1 Tax=Cellulomonas chitinilytica TaxID=398759 RepID=A0A919NZQ0_9CELL|nr:hypothetical protein [Cellulomonas chitinilytica]GIG20666.1 hypothetical protein Cch01nite_13900 [Cellulomonas chitinilytica]
MTAGGFQRVKAARDAAYLRGNPTPPGRLDTSWVDPSLSLTEALVLIADYHAGYDDRV